MIGQSPRMEYGQRIMSTSLTTGATDKKVPWWKRVLNLIKRNQYGLAVQAILIIIFILLIKLQGQIYHNSTDIQISKKWMQAIQSNSFFYGPGNPIDWAARFDSQRRVDQLIFYTCFVLFPRDQSFYLLLVICCSIMLVSLM